MMEQHTASKHTYYRVWGILIALLLITAGVSYLDLGPLNIVVSLTIAVGKALLIMLFFMHVRDSRRLIWIFVGLGFFWLVILLSLTMSDYLTRSWLPVAGW
jgi:cytochrome c oxidase subunit IV